MPLDDIVYVRRAVLVELDVMTRAFLLIIDKNRKEREVGNGLTKDDYSDVDRAKYAQLVCLFEQAILTLETGEMEDDMRNIYIGCAKTEQK